MIQISIKKGNLDLLSNWNNTFSSPSANYKFANTMNYLAKNVKL